MPLASVLTFAGTYGLVVGWAGPAACGWLAGPEECTQDTAIRAFVAESLAASLFLFGPPLMALGMATPLLVQRASSEWPAGRAAGINASAPPFSTASPSHPASADRFSQ